MRSTPRLFVESVLSAAAEIELSGGQAHYLTAVMRLGPGDPVRLFNARDGEWLAYLAAVSRKSTTVRAESQLAAVRPPPDIDYLFAPLKHARLDYVVQKATELGARRLRPVITERTIVSRVNLDRMRANAIEAAEQCNLVFVPEVAEPELLGVVVSCWETGRTLVYCDERAPIADPVGALRAARLPAALLVGPEGGFTDDERALVTSLPKAIAISLGPRIMRADTAAVAALALLQATMGDWHQDR